MDTGEVGIISAIVSLLTLIISKWVETLQTRMKLNSELRIKKNEHTHIENLSLQEDFLDQWESFKKEIDDLRNENLTLQVENARMEVTNDHLSKEIVELSNKVEELVKEVTYLKQLNSRIN